MRNFFVRLREIEGAIAARLGNPVDRALWAELQGLFCAVPEHAAMVDALAAKLGHRWLPAMLSTSKSDDSVTMSLIGKLRKALGEFCAQHRYRCPQASVIWVRAIREGPCMSMVVPNVDGGFTQIVQSRAMVRRMTNDGIQLIEADHGEF
jgi:hypothetical protein